MGRQISYFFLCCCLLLAALNGCSDELTSDPGQQAIIPVTCHREDGIGLLFIRLENQNSHDLHSASMQLSFQSLNAPRGSIHMRVSIPSIPSLQERLMTINVPVIRPDHYSMPDGPLTIQLQLPHEIQQPTTIYTKDCYDPQ